MSAGRVVQAGSPQDLYLAPATEFAADFLGVSTRFTARAEPGLLVLDETRQRLPYAGDVRGPVVLVLRSSDVALGEAAPTLDGDLEESLFLGDRWRHYVRLGGAMLIVDGDAPHAAGPVRVSVSRDRLRVYPQGGSPC